MGSPSLSAAVKMKCDGVYKMLTFGDWCSVINATYLTGSLPGARDALKAPAPPLP